MVSRVHGGKLVNQVATSNRLKSLLGDVNELPTVELSYESAVDVESIAHGIYSPLEGFMNNEAYRSVLDEMRLPNDLPWTIPIVLDVSKETVKDVKAGDTVALSAPVNVPIAVMHV